MESKRKRAFSNSEFECKTQGIQVMRGPDGIMSNIGLQADQKLVQTADLNYLILPSNSAVIGVENVQQNNERAFSHSESECKKQRIQVLRGPDGKISVRGLQANQKLVQTADGKYLILPSTSAVIGGKIVGRKSERAQSGSDVNIKKPKFSYDYSDLPTEILLMIFEYLNWLDKKKLIETCHRFKDVLEPDLKLRLDFDRIKHDNCVYPKLLRAHEEMEIIGREIDTDKEKLRAVLKPSSQSLQVLSIGQQSGTKITLPTLLFILNCLPTIQTLKLKSLDILLPQISFEDPKYQDYSTLANLRTLVFESKYTGENGAFKKVSGLRVIKILIGKAPNSQIKMIVHAQRNLKVLVINEEANFKKKSLLTLTKMVISNHSTLNQVFSAAPNILTLVVKQDQNLTPLLLTGQSSELLKIKIHSNVEENFAIENILKNYPSLEVFESKNFKWRQN